VCTRSCRSWDFELQFDTALRVRVRSNRIEQLASEEMILSRDIHSLMARYESAEHAAVVEKETKLATKLSVFTAHWRCLKESTTLTAGTLRFTRHSCVTETGMKYRKLIKGSPDFIRLFAEELLLDPREIVAHEAWYKSYIHQREMDKREIEDWKRAKQRKKNADSSVSMEPVIEEPVKVKKPLIDEQERSTKLEQLKEYKVVASNLGS
jgi:hypothetical protein